MQYIILDSNNICHKAISEPLIHLENDIPFLVQMKGCKFNRCFPQRRSHHFKILLVAWSGNATIGLKVFASSKSIKA